MTTLKKTEYKIKTATIRLLTPNIVENIINDNTELGIDELIELKKINKQLTEGKPYAVLVDSGMLTSITKEGREFIATKQFQQQTIAKALLVRSLGHRLVGRFYIRINKPHTKTKIFSDRDKAIQWLKICVNEKLNNF